MQTQMNFFQFSTLNKKVAMIQIQQNQLAATGVLLTSIQLNYLLTNDEAEIGLSSTADDLGKYY
jgi:hypothetical protein